MDIRIETVGLTERYAQFPIQGSMTAAGYTAAQIASIADELAAVVARHTAASGEVTNNSTTNIVFARVS